MKELIKEYGGMIIAVVSTTCFLFIMGNLFFAQNGALCRLILFWGHNSI